MRLAVFAVVIAAAAFIVDVDAFAGKSTATASENSTTDALQRLVRVMTTLDNEKITTRRYQGSTTTDQPDTQFLTSEQLQTVQTARPPQILASLVAGAPSRFDTICEPGYFMQPTTKRCRKIIQ